MPGSLQVHSVLQTHTFSVHLVFCMVLLYEGKHPRFSPSARAMVFQSSPLDALCDIFKIILCMCLTIHFSRACFPYLPSWTFHRVLKQCSSMYALSHALICTKSSISWFVNLSTVGGFFGWASINVTYFFFCELIFRTSCFIWSHKLCRSRNEIPRYWPHEAPLLEPFPGTFLLMDSWSSNTDTRLPAMAFHLGSGVVHHLYSHQRFQRLLELHSSWLPHLLWVYTRCSVKSRLIIVRRHQRTAVRWSFCVLEGDEEDQSLESRWNGLRNSEWLGGFCLTLLLTCDIRVFPPRRRQRAPTTHPRVSGKKSLLLCSDLCRGGCCALYFLRYKL